MNTNPPLKAFDITRHLNSQEAIAEYERQVVADGDKDEIARSHDHIAKAQAINALNPKTDHQI